MTPCFQHDSYRTECADCRDMGVGIEPPAVQPLPDEHACDWMARRIALAGLGTVNGANRFHPPENAGWTQEEWQRRILEVIPGRCERHCRQLALELYRKVTGATDR